MAESQTERPPLHSADAFHAASTIPAGPGWDRLSAHSLRHTGITMALDAGVPLRDVQDYARHRDARTTRRYDHSRDSLDRNVVYAVAAYLG